MKRFRIPWLLATASTAIAFSAVGQNAATVGDILKRPVDVRVGEKAKGNAETARQNYEAFLAMAADDDGLRADALRRLGDLKLESGEEERIGKELSGAAPLGTQDAIKIYVRLLETVPDYPRADAVLYQLARAYDTAGDDAQSLKSLDTLIAKFPESPLLAEAYFRRGEHFFSRRDWTSAAKSYEALLAATPKSEFREQATYKLGWSRFKLGDNDAALDAFVQVLDRELIGPDGRERDVESFSRPQRELVEDTLRVASIVFSGDEGTVGIEKFLTRRGERVFADQFFASLGDWYASKERWTDAAAAYSGFSRLKPHHERAPVLQSVAIDALRRGGFTDLVLAAKQDFVDRYGMQSSYWTHQERAAHPLVVREVRQNLQDLAAYYHELAQKTKEPLAYQNAATWYRAYLQQFPDDSSAADTAYLLADALFESQQYAQAADEYRRVAYEYPASSHGAEAAYAELVALERQESPVAPAERSSIHELALTEGARFARAYPLHPESGTVLVRTARQRFDGRQYAEAIELADAYLGREHDGASALDIEARLVLVNAEFELQHFDRAEVAASALLQRLDRQDSRRVTVESRLAAAIFRQAEAAREAGNKVEAAQAFLRAADVAPQTDVREAAEFDAAAAYLAAEEWGPATHVLEEFRQRYPTSTRLSEVTRRLAAAYLANSQGLLAAREFEKLSADNGSDPDAQRAALLQAADLYRAAADHGAESSALALYVRRFETPLPAATEARQRLADLAQEGGDPTARKSWLEEIVRTNPVAASADDARGMTLAGRASLELATPLRESFRAIHLTTPLKKSLELKRAALEKALAAYQRADRYSIADVSTRATFEEAELYRQMAEDLMQSERPRNLSAEALEQYGLLLEEQAFPFEEKSIELHEINVSRLASQGIYDGATRESLAVLAKLKPARYGKFDQSEDLTINLLPDGSGDPSIELTVRFQEAVAAAAGNPVRAAAELAALVPLMPSTAGPQFDAAVLAETQGNPTQAESALQNVLQKAPNYAPALDELGVVLRNLGRFGEAEKAYRAALEADPESVRTRRNLGVLLDLYLDRPAEAIPEWKKAIELEGTDKELESWVTEASHRIHKSTGSSEGSHE